VARAPGPRAALILQGSAHGSALRYLHLSEIDGWTSYLLPGARPTPTRSRPMAMGVVENLVVTERGTDIAAILGLSWQLRSATTANLACRQAESHSAKECPGDAWPRGRSPSPFVT
jgi:hypothetical protein